MPIYKTVLTQHDIDFGFSSEMSFDTTTGRRGLHKGSPNLQGALYNAPKRPDDIPENNNRLTVALDIGFWNGYLDTSHFFLGARYPVENYTQAGDNRCGAVILGAWDISKGSFKRAAALEEPEMDGNLKNIHHNDTPNVIQKNRRYRVTLDSIYLNGLMMHEIRAKDHPTGQTVYTLGRTIISDYTANYMIASTRIALATLFGGGGGSYSNLHVYWSLGGEWVANP